MSDRPAAPAWSDYKRGMRWGWRAAVADGHMDWVTEFDGMLGGLFLWKRRDGTHYTTQGGMGADGIWHYLGVTSPP